MKLPWEVAGSLAVKKVLSDGSWTGLSCVMSSACKHMGFETHVAVVHRCRSRVVVVRRCEMCKKSVVLYQMLKTVGIVHKKKTQNKYNKATQGLQNELRKTLRTKVAMP